MLCAKQRVHGRGRLLVEDWYEVTVGIQRQGDSRVAQHLGHHLGVRPPSQEERCGGVPEVMKPDSGQACPHEGALKHRGLPARVERPAGRIAEDEVLVLPQRAGREPLFELAPSMVPERGNRALTSHDRPA
jgi:hypothetical protein